MSEFAPPPAPAAVQPYAPPPPPVAVAAPVVVAAPAQPSAPPAAPLPAAATGPGLSIPPTPAPDQGGRSLRKRAVTNASAHRASSGMKHGGGGGDYSDDDDLDLLNDDGTPAADRTTRSGTSFANRPRWMPKLKLKVNEGSDGRKQSFLGPYDRDLDSEDEELVFEEQFILRMPPGKECERLRELVARRGAAGDVWFKFKDPRRAVFHIGESLHSAKLVDLPCIIESQKTLDNKHMFKVADICQSMLVVEDATLPNEDTLLSTKKAFNANEFIWPHGVTPPLQHVRKRRFRKRLNRQAIETVENEVDRLLQEEKHATVQEFIFEDDDPDLSDSEYLRRVMPAQSPDEGGFNEGEGKEENDDDAFAAAIEQALQQGSDGDDEDGESGRAGKGGTARTMVRMGMGTERAIVVVAAAAVVAVGRMRMRMMKSIVVRKSCWTMRSSSSKWLLRRRMKISQKSPTSRSSWNPPPQTRFINAVAKMSADLEGKLTHRQQLLAEHRAQREKDLEEGEESVEEDEVEGGEEMFGETMDIA